MDLDVIAKFIDFYGLPVLCLYLLIAGILKVAKWAAPKLDDIWKRFMGISSVINNDKDVVVNAFKFDATVNSILSESSEHFEASWVHLWQFHNGVHNVGRLPFIFLALTHEKTNSDVPEIRKYFERIPTAMFNKLGGMIMKNEVIIHRTPIDGEEDEWGQFGIGLTNLGIGSGCFYPIRNKDNDLVGLFSVAWPDKYHVIECEDKMAVQKYADRLSRVMAEFTANSNGKEK